MTMEVSINSGNRLLQAFSNMGIPGSKHEEWKYTRIAGLFNKEFQLPADPLTGIRYNVEDLDKFRLPGHEQANELVFVNGFYSFSLSRIRSSGLRGDRTGRSCE